MELTRSEENRNRIISAVGTAIIFGLLLLFLILYHLITPNPPFPESGGGGGGRLMSLGMMNVGNDDLDYGSMGKITDVVTEATPTKQEVLEDPNGDVVIPQETAPKVKEEKMVIKPATEKQKTAAEKMRETFKKSQGKGKGGGVGESETAGQQGEPNGDPNEYGKGGTGNGGKGGDGKGDGPGGPGEGHGGNNTGIGKGSGFAFNLSGATIATPPKLPADTKEEGKVVVEITVDKDGNVIEAIPNGRGTTTNSVALKMKAKQAALNTKFKVSGKFEEQSGTLTIVFSFD